VSDFDSDHEFPFDPASPLVSTGNLRRRQVVSRLAQTAATLGAFLAILMLGLMLYTVVSRGIGAISWEFITSPPEGTGGGIGPALVGSAIIVALATLIAAPIGVMTAIFTTEYAGEKLGGTVRLALDVMNGLPSIVIGIFIYALIVAGHHQSGFAGSLALAIIMLPTIARTSQEVLSLVPDALRDGAEALGVPRWRVISGVILPTAMGGIVTGIVLAAARAAGETAPLILVSLVFPAEFVLNPFSSSAMPNVPVSIFNLSETADPTGFERAWGAALLLLTGILIANIAARTLLGRSKKKNGLT
jgi:phosphate transport system permease protein